MDDKKLQKANQKFEKQQAKRKPEKPEDGKKQKLSDQDLRKFLGCGG